MGDDDTGSFYPFSSIYQPKLTNEEFNDFHNIDRKLFYRLVRRLGRGIDESMKMVAFLIWLERAKYSFIAVRKVVDWPLNLVNQLCTEVSRCLARLENDKMSYKEQNGDMYLLRKLCVIDLNMNLLNENKYKVIGGVSNIIAHVCLRAFDDIISGKDCRYLDVDNGEERRMTAFQNPNFVPPRPPVPPPGPPLPPPPGPPLPPPFYPSSYNAEKRMLFVPPPSHPHPHRQPFNLNMDLGGFPQLGFGGNVGFPISRPNKSEIENILGNPNIDLSALFGGMKLVDGCEDEPHVPADDRTIFLTFSKGYYIPESEIRDFFTGIFGDFIEGIYMQEVTKDEQPLFARMVCRSSSVIPAIAPPGTKEKYSINGKHIWAKKYVRKNNHRSSSSSSVGTSSSPAAAGAGAGAAATTSTSYQVKK